MSWKWSDATVQLGNQGNFSPESLMHPIWVAGMRVKFGAVAIAQRLFSIRDFDVYPEPLALLYFYDTSNTLRLYCRDWANTNQVVGNYVWSSIQAGVWYSLVVMRRATNDWRVRLDGVEIITGTGTWDTYEGGGNPLERWAFGGLWNYDGVAWYTSGNLTANSLMCDMGLWTPATTTDLNDLVAAYEDGEKPSNLNDPAWGLKDAWDRNIDNAKVSTGPAGTPLTTYGGAGTITYDGADVPTFGGTIAPQVAYYRQYISD